MFMRQNKRMCLIVAAVTEFNRFYAPESIAAELFPILTIPPSQADEPQQQQQPAARTEDRERQMEMSLPPIDPAMFRLPFPGSEPMKTESSGFPSSSMQMADIGAMARPQDWLSEY